jgi:hypothetical protein
MCQDTIQLLVSLAKGNHLIGSDEFDLVPRFEKERGQRSDKRDRRFKPLRGLLIRQWHERLKDNANVEVLILAVFRENQVT